MKVLYTVVIAVGLFLAYSTVQAKELTPQEIEVKQLAQELKEKRQELKLIKAQKAADKANARLASLKSGK